MAKKTEQEMLDALDAAEGGDVSTDGLPMSVRAKTFYKRNHLGTPVKVCAASIDRCHSRVTEIAGGRDYDRYNEKTRAEFIAAIQAEYAKVGLVYTGDFHKNHSSKKLKPKPAAAAAE